MRVGDVANEHGRAVDDADRHVVELVEPGWRTVERHDIFEVADLFGSDGRDDILPADRVDHVLRRQSVGLQLVLIDVDLHLEDLASVGRGNRRACDLRQLRPDEILSGVLKLRLRERLARQRQLNDRDARSVEAENEGRRNSLRQVLKDGLRGRRRLRQRGVDVDAGLEEDLDDAVPRQGLRLDMLDIVDLTC